MDCSQCGGPLAPDAAFCGRCGAPVVEAEPGVLRRPVIVTVLAILQLIGAAVSLLGALALMAGATLGSGYTEPGSVPVGLLLAVVGVAELLCGIGLLKLQPRGRTLLLVFAWVGLLGFPVGTIVSILILVYLHKPGIKALFSGKHVSEFSPDERAQIAAVTGGSVVATVLVVLLVGLLGVVMAGIVAAIAIPGLLRARVSGNEASAIGSLRSINSGQATYSASCAAGGFAITLDDLAKPATGGLTGFVSPDLLTNGVTKSGYRVTIARDAAAGVVDTGTAADTCNASTNPPASSYFASAEPVTPGTTGIRYFATDARGIIFQSSSPIANPIDASTVVPVE